MLEHNRMGGGMKLECSLSRIQYVILHNMRKQKATHHMRSMSCNEICSIMENRFKVTTMAVLPETEESEEKENGK